MSREPQPPLLRAGANKLVRAPGAVPDQLRQRAAQHQAHQPQQTQRRANTPVSSAAAGRAAAGRPAAVPQRQPPQQQPQGRSKTWTRPATAQRTNAADVGPSQATAALHAPAVPARPATLAFGAPRQQSQRQSKTWTRSGAAAAMHHQQQQAQSAAGQTAAALAKLLPAQAAAATQAAATSAATVPAAARLPTLRAIKPAVHKTLPAGMGGKTVTVLSGGVSGGQQRLLVYKKGKRGKSLQRTAVKAAARGGLTWRNPATAIGGIVSCSGPASGQPAVAAGVPPPAAPGPSNSSGTGTAAALMLHRRRSGKWHKYVRAAAKVLVTDPAAPKQAIAARASSPAVSPGRKQQSLGSGAMAVGRGGSKLLRLGGDLYKVVRGKGKSKSLRRQSVSKPAAGAAVQVQQQHAAAVPLLAAAAHGTRRLGSYKLVLAASTGAHSRRSPGSKSPAAAAAKHLPLKPQGGVSKVVGAAAKKLQQQQPAAAAAAAAAGKAAGERSSGSRRSSGTAVGIVYCPIYCRTGKCERRGKGCPYKHDSTKRAVCPRWLHGTCALGTACSLQHQRKPELMPICMHFLKGCCTAELCPYVHINLPAGAPICTRFLRGYCPAGTACPHKHYTLRMVRDEKRMEAAPGASAAGGRTAGRGSGKRKERHGSGGRYFDDALPLGGSASAQQRSKDSMQGGEGNSQEGKGKAAEPDAKRQRHSNDGAASDPLKPAFLSADFVPL